MDNESVSSKAANLLRGMIQAGTWKTEQDIFRRGLYVREAGVVALPQALAQ